MDKEILGLMFFGTVLLVVWLFVCHPVYQIIKEWTKERERRHSRHLADIEYAKWRRLQPSPYCRRCERQGE